MGTLTTSISRDGCEEIYDKLKQNPDDMGPVLMTSLTLAPSPYGHMTDQDKVVTQASEIIQAATSAKMQGRTPRAWDRIFEGS